MMHIVTRCSQKLSEDLRNSSTAQKMPFLISHSHSLIPPRDEPPNHTGFSSHNEQMLCLMNARCVRSIIESKCIQPKSSHTTHCIPVQKACNRYEIIKPKCENLARVRVISVSEVSTVVCNLHLSLAFFPQRQVDAMLHAVPVQRVVAFLWAQVS